MSTTPSEPASQGIPPRSEPIAAGEPAPDFSLEDQHRQPWSLAEAVSRGPVVLCFYPLAFTGVCGSEMECLTSEMDRWAGRGVQMVGISCDSTAANKAWADQLGLKHTLLSDMHREVCRGYGLYWPELNVAHRGTVVISGTSTGRGEVIWSQAREPGRAMDLDEVLATLA